MVEATGGKAQSSGLSRRPGSGKAGFLDLRSPSEHVTRRAALPSPEGTASPHPSSRRCRPADGCDANATRRWAAMGTQSGKALLRRERSLGCLVSVSVSVSVCMAVYVFTCLSICLSFCFCLSVCLLDFLCDFVCQSRPTSLSLSTFVSLPLCLSALASPSSLSPSRAAENQEQGPDWESR